VGNCLRRFACQIGGFARLDHGFSTREHMVAIACYPVVTAAREGRELFRPGGESRGRVVIHAVT